MQIFTVEIAEGDPIRLRGPKLVKEVRETLAACGKVGTLREGDVWLTDSDELEPGHTYRFIATPPEPTPIAGALKISKRAAPYKYSCVTGSSAAQMRSTSPLGLPTVLCQDNGSSMLVHGRTCSIMALLTSDAT